VTYDVRICIHAHTPWILLLTTVVLSLHMTAQYLTVNTSEQYGNEVRLPYQKLLQSSQETKGKCVVLEVSYGT
jgi:hypothetical protein